MQSRQRLLALAVLIVTAGALCVHYGGAYDENWPHPSGDQLAAEPAGWDGERVLLFGTVTDRTANGFTIEVETDSGEVARVVDVRDAGATADVGGSVQVYGELSDRGTVQQAESVVVVNESPSDHLYKLGTSGVGLLLAAASFLWYWRIDWRRLRFVRPGGDDDG